MVLIEAAQGCLSDGSYSKRQIYGTSFIPEEAPLKKSVMPPLLKAVLCAIFKDAVVQFGS